MSDTTARASLRPSIAGSQVAWPLLLSLLISGVPSGTAVVVDDVSPGATVVGNPARRTDVDGEAGASAVTEEPAGSPGDATPACRG